MNSVLSALSASYGSDAQRQSEAHKYLFEWQVSDRCWRDCLSLLAENHNNGSDSTRRIRLFASTTLHNKSLYEWRSLNPSASLRRKYYASVWRQLASERSQAAKSYLALALAAALLYELGIEGEQGNWVRGIYALVAHLETLGALDEAKASAAVGDGVAALWVCACVPEQLARVADLNVEERARARRSLGDDVVRRVLAAATATMVGGAWQSKALDTCTAWLGLAALDVRVVAECGVVREALARLSSPVHSASASLLAQEVLLMRGAAQSRALLAMVADALLRLRASMSRASHAGYVEHAHSLCALLAKLLEAHGDTLLPSERGRALIALLCDCVALDDHELCMRTLDAWDAVFEWMLADGTDGAESLLVGVMRALCAHCAFDDPDRGAADSSEDDSVAERRREIEERLCALYMLLRARAYFGVVVSLLRTAGDAEQPWQQAETALFAMLAVGDAVQQQDCDDSDDSDGDDDDIDERQQCIAAALGFFGQLPSASSACVRRTAVRVLGRYAQWFAAHANKLRPAVSMLGSALSDDGTAASAAHALRALAERCAHMLVGALPALWRCGARVLASPTHPARRDLVRALARIVAFVESADDASAHLGRLLSPIYAALKRAMPLHSADAESDARLAARATLLSKLRELASAVVALSPPSTLAISPPPCSQRVLASAIDKLWTLLSSVLRLWVDDEAVVDVIFGVYQQALLGVGVALRGHLRDLLNLASGAFERCAAAPRSVLDAVRVALKVFELVDGAAPLFAATLDRLVARALGALRADPSALPELYAATFRLGHQAIACMPAAIVDRRSLPALLRFAMRSLYVQRLPRPARSALSFVEALFGHQRDARWHHLVAERVVAANAPLVAELVGRLLAAVAGRMDRKLVVRPVAQVLRALAQHHPSACAASLRAAIGQLRAPSIDTAYRRRLYEQLTATPPDQRAIERALDHLAIDSASSSSSSSGDGDGVVQFC
jgi:hypothetical protein